MEDVEKLHFSKEELFARGGRVLHQFGVPSTYKIHTHDFYELFLVPKGRAVHRINGRAQLLTAGAFVLVRPRDVHKYEFLGNADFEVLNIGIPEPVFCAVCDYLCVDRARFDAPELPPLCVLSGYALSDAQHKLLRSNRFDAPEDGARYMLSVFPYFVQLFLTDALPEAAFPAWLSQLLEKMDAPENYTAGLPRLLELANMSQEHLTRSFRRFIGTTPTAYINAKRLSLAARLLLEGELSVLDVSTACGFNSLSRFYKLFSARYGCAPKAFCRASAGETDST